MSLLRVLTWNIHGCIGRDRKHDVERVAARIRQLRPDLAALQEVDTRRRPSQVLPNVEENIADYLRRQVGDHAHDAWTLSSADGHYGQILASRFPLATPEIHDISVLGREPRKVITAHVETGDQPFRVIATHLGLGRGERRRQVAALKEIIAAEPNMASILLGDLNEWRRGDVQQRSLLTEFESGTAHASFPARFPLFALDRILCRQGIRLGRSWVDRGAQGASDHLPVVADIAFGE